MVDRKEQIIQLAGYRADVVRLEAEAAELDVRRDEVQKQIQQTKKVIASLMSLVGLDAGVNVGEMGFTDACRAMLNNAHPEWISASEIREALTRAGFDLSGYVNAMASIHTILRRLEESGEVEKDEQGKRIVFRWNPKIVALGASVVSVPRNEAVIAKAAGIYAKKSPTDLSDPNHPLVKAGIQPLKEKK